MPVATAELPLIVQFVIVMEPELSTPPPNAVATAGKRGSKLPAEHVLPLMVELVIINEPEWFDIPPPSEVKELSVRASLLAELLLIVQPVMVMVPFSFSTPPPPPTVSLIVPLLLIVQPVMVMVPLSFITPPPPRIMPKLLPVKLSEMVQSVSVNTPALRIPPPPGPSCAKPFEIVIPEIETVTVLELMLKTRALMRLLSTCTVKRLAPGPVMVRFLSITNSPLVRVTVVTLGAKLIVSPDEASRIACRKEPGPLVIPIRDRDGRRWHIGRTQQQRTDHARQIENRHT